MSLHMTQPRNEDLWIVVVRFSPEKPEIPYSVPMSYEGARAHMEEGQRADKVEKVNHIYRLVRAADWQ